MKRIAEKLLNLSVWLLLACHFVLAEDLPDAKEEQNSQLMKQLSLQSAAELQSCLSTSKEDGCGMFQCFNNSCEIQALNRVCLTLLHNAGQDDSESKSFVEAALRRMALGLQECFSCESQECSAVDEMMLLLEKECYTKHHLCVSLQDYVEIMENLVQFQFLSSQSMAPEDVEADAECVVVVGTTCVNKIQIFVKNPAGKTIVVDVEPNDTVENLMTEIEKMEGLASDQHRLTYAGEQLEESRTLSDYDVQKGSTLHLLPQSN